MPFSETEKTRRSVDSTYVFDSFALMAHFEGESRGKKATELLSKALSGKPVIYMSVINIGEVYYITMRERGIEKAEEMMMLLEQLPIRVLPSDKELTIEAAKLKASHPVAYADCFAAALAMKKNVKVVTGDPEFGKFEKKVGILWI